MRTPDLTRDQLDPAGQAAWDAIAGSRGGVRGPYQPLMQVPVMAERIAHLGTYLRFEGLLDGTDRELAILVVARHVGARFEWVAHEAIARQEGTRPEAIAAVLAQSGLEGLTDRERLVVEVARALLQDNRLPAALFDRARADLGLERIVELVGLIGYYAMIAFVLVAFEVEPSAGSAPF